MSKTIKESWKELYELPKKELFLLIKEYDNYVIETTNREDGSVPVCLLEFFENDYQELLEKIKGK